MLRHIPNYMRMLRDARQFAGIPVTLQWLWLRFCQEKRIARTGKWKARPHQVKEPLAVCLAATSDLRVFEQIFLWEEYSCLRNLEGVSLIMDLGANVGFSSAYFLSCFPNARVVAVEPDARNVAACRENLKPYGDRSLVLHGAVWSECTRVCLSENGGAEGREWARQVEQPQLPERGDIEAWDVQTLIDMTGKQTVDLLKVDIERGELAMFGPAARTWLTRIRNICIELHGQDCREAFFSALADFTCDLSYAGELTICRNLRLREYSIQQ